jgi:hypothetical protein
VLPANRVALKVERQTKCVAGELDHLALHGVFQAMYTGNAVGDTDHSAFVTRFGRDVQFVNALPDQFADFRRVQSRLHGFFPV